jgi:hypothetical protein
LPWKDWELPWYKKLLLFSFEKKIEKFEDFLSKKGINIIPKYELPLQTQDYINDKIKACKTFKDLKKFIYKKSFFAGTSCFSSLISRYNSIYNFKNIYSNFPKALKSGCVVYERALKVIKDINPDEIITFNNRFVISRPIIDATKKLKKKIIIHERGSSNKKFMLFEDDLFDKLYFSKIIRSHWNNNKKITYAKKIMIAKKFFLLNIKKNFFKSMGLLVESRSINKVELNKKKEIITFFCTTDHEYISLPKKRGDRNFFLNAKWSNQIEAIKSLINVIKQDENKFLFIKAHPNFSKKSVIENNLKKLQSFNVKYLSNSQNIDSIDLIKKSDIIVTFGSSLELTAKFLNKKVISMFKHLYSPLGIFSYPRNEKSLKDMVYGNITQKKNSINNLYKVAYFLMTFGINYKYFKFSSYYRGIFLEEKINHFGPLINFFIKLKFLRY